MTRKQKKSSTSNMMEMARTRSSQARSKLRSSMETMRRPRSSRRTRTPSPESQHSYDESASAYTRETGESASTRGDSLVISNKRQLKDAEPKTKMDDSDLVSIVSEAEDAEARLTKAKYETKEKKRSKTKFIPTGDASLVSTEMSLSRSSSRLYASSLDEGEPTSASTGSSVTRTVVSAGQKKKRFRGFSTSISDLFREESIVCPAFSCFGIMLSQRTEFFLNLRNERRGHKKRSPSLLVGRIFLACIVIAVLSYVIFGIPKKDLGTYEENYYDENRRMQQTNSIFDAFRAIRLIRHHHTFLSQTLFPSLPSSSRRLVQSSSDIGAIIRSALYILFLLTLGVLGRRRHMRTRYALIRARAHDDHLFQISQNDTKLYPKEDKYEGACSHTLCGCYPSDPPEMRTDPEGEDCIQKFNRCFNGCCCGVVCKCWIQCLSICALTQEAREAATLIPRKFQRVDYITHQRFEDYYEKTLAMRRRQAEYNVGCMAHWKTLSALSRYVLFFSVVSVLLICLLLVINPSSAFGWANTLVLLCTFIESFALLYVIHWLFHKSDLSLDAVVKLYAAGFLIATPTAFFLEAVWITVCSVILYCVQGILILVRLESVLNFFEHYSVILWSVVEICNAFLVAATTEELCKYYTFRMVEHPDLLFLNVSEKKEVEEEALKSWNLKSSGADDVEAVSFNSDDSPYSVDDGIKKLPAAVHRETLRTLDGSIVSTNAEETRTIRQMAAAVAVAMVSVSVGLACAENFIYVFFLEGLNVRQQGLTLILRSVFPIHALCAAMQSIGIIRKHIEGDEDMGVGSIVRPAIMLHGSFDAVLMLVNFVTDMTGMYYNFWINGFALLMIIMVLALGVWWYWEERRKQRIRLILMSEDESTIRNTSEDTEEEEVSRRESRKKSRHRRSHSDATLRMKKRKEWGYVSPDITQEVPRG